MPSSGGSVSDAPVNKVVDGQEHQLSYITPGEAQNLVDQGGQEVITNEGIPAYPPLGEPGTSPGTNVSGGARHGNEGPAGGASAGGNYGGNVNPSQTYAGHTVQEQKDYNANPKDFIEKQNQVKQDLTFKEHWANAPESIKFSPTLRFLYSSGKNVGEWASKKGWNISGTNTTDTTGWSPGVGRDKQGYLSNHPNYSGDGNNTGSGGNTNERDMMNAIAPEAPYIVSGITPPSSSPAANWYSNLGTTNTNQHGTSIATQYAAAKTAVSQTLQNKGAIGMLAVNKSPFYDWLKTNKIDKGIL